MSPECSLSIAGANGLNSRRCLIVLTLSSVFDPCGSVSRLQFLTALEPDSQRLLATPNMPVPTSSCILSGSIVVKRIFLAKRPHLRAVLYFISNPSKRRDDCCNYINYYLNHFFAFNLIFSGELSAAAAILNKVYTCPYR
jgi:hypothetical protein